MDKMIDHVNQKILIKRGYDPMPLHLYSYYQKVCTYIQFIKNWFSIKIVD